MLLNTLPKATVMQQEDLSRFYHYKQSRMV